jgi:HTH-type transcriptional regulator, transcriptional repressor of NAD biosynthesis genes
MIQSTSIEANRMKIFRVAILGAECTGKTTLCAELAKELLQQQFDETLNIKIVPEALRQFCEINERVPIASEQLGIMRDQAQLEYLAIDSLTQKHTASSLLISDCAPITIAIYSELYFNDLSLFAEASNHHQSYDLTVLLSPTLGWKEDGIFRESLAAQWRFHEKLKHWLSTHRFAWVEIALNGPARTVSAMNAIIEVIR